MPSGEELFLLFAICFLDQAFLKMSLKRPVSSTTPSVFGGLPNGLVHQQDVTRPRILNYSCRRVSFAIVCLISFVASLLLAFKYGGTRFIDFPSFYYASQAALRGESAYANLSALASTYVHPFLYPPQGVFFLLPLGFLGELETASQSFLMINLILLWGCVIAVLAGITTLIERQVWLVFCFVVVVYLSQTLRSNIYHGQVNIIVLSSILAGWFGLLRGRHWGAVLLVPAVAIKIYPIFIAWGLLLQHRYRDCVTFAAMAIVVSVATYIVVPKQTWLDFYLLVAGSRLKVAGAIDFATIENMSLAGVAKRSFGADLGWWLYIAAAILIMLVSSAVVRKAKTLGLAFAVFLPVGFLISPLAWEHHVIFELPTIAYLIDGGLRERSLSYLAGVAIPASICLAPRYPSVFFEYSVVTFAVVCLWLLTLMWGLKLQAAGVDDGKAIDVRPNT